MGQEIPFADAQASDCDSGKVLAGAKAEAANKEQTLTALDSTSATLRRGLGESDESLERFQVPTGFRATTVFKLEALEAIFDWRVSSGKNRERGRQRCFLLPTLG